MKNHAQIVYHVATVSLIVNIILSLVKLAVGFFAQSNAIFADGIHSSSDVFSTLIVIVGLYLANQEADSKHPYGHEKIEDIASLLLSIILFLLALRIAWNGIINIQSCLTGEYAIPGKMALITALFSIAVKEWMFWYTRKAARKTQSTALLADAWHHRSDALSSVGSFIGVGGALLGFPVMDPAVSILIAGMIIKVAFDIAKVSIAQLIDESANPKVAGEIQQIVQNIPGVLQIDDLKTRMHASRLFVDLEIAADSTLSLIEAHGIAEAVHHAVERGIPSVKHCMVHVNPVGTSTKEKNGKKNESV